MATLTIAPGTRAAPFWHCCWPAPRSPARHRSPPPRTAAAAASCRPITRKPSSSGQPSNGQPSSAKRRPGPACCGCCRAIPSPSTRSRSRAASSTTRRRPEPFRCSINRASARRRSIIRPCGQGRRPGRPLTFVFNGGPGAASAFLNLGLVGPRIAQFAPDRPRRRGDQAAGQSRHLARLHRPGADRSGGLGLEPARQGGRRQRLLGRAARCRFDGESDRPLCRQQCAGRLAQISFWARAMAAFAPPRWRGPCRSSRASSSPAS